jgi:hypothetical protein
MDNQLIKRLKSFGWRLLVAGVTFGLSWLAQNIGLLELPIWAEGIIALGLGEVTKWWNTKMQLAGRGFFGGIKK